MTFTDRIKSLQRRIGVEADGLVGPVTLTRLEEVVEQALGPVPAPAEPETSMVVSHRGLHALIAYEITSRARYERDLANPIWPGAHSGVTIGIGYDLGMTGPTIIDDDWRGRIPDTDLERLKVASGVTGTAARDLLPRLDDITIPYEAAEEVFLTESMPTYAQRTRRAFPGVEDLPPDAQAALLSLVYNRGGSMTGSRRREMAAIRDLVPSGDLDAIAEQLLAMRRLWNENTLPGLHRRREDEAELVAGADRDYEEGELVRV